MLDRIEETRSGPWSLPALQYSLIYLGSFILTHLSVQPDSRFVVGLKSSVDEKLLTGDSLWNVAETLGMEHARTMISKYTYNSKVRNCPFAEDAGGK